MKKILISTILAAFIIAGCMSDNNINNVPVNSGENKIEWIVNSGSINKTETELTISKNINGNSGGRILISQRLGIIDISGSLTIPQGAYPGNQTISITFNDLWFYQVYNPTPYFFRTSLILNLVYSNLKLDNIDPARVNFYYLDETGKYFTAQTDSIIVDPASGTLGVIGAKIPHFSRWGWAKATDE